MAVNLKIKDEFKKVRGPIIKKVNLKKIIKQLPYKLTADQDTVLDEIASDFNKYYPMNRLIQGDVGSGKTIVAFLCAIQAVISGYQVAFMAPTEILALQHFETFVSLVKELKIDNVGVRLITSKLAKSQGNGNIIIGTHSLLNHKFTNLGLVIIDEQQRFGVEQRNLLVAAGKIMPHFLSLSATPIPRSLAHVIFSNCDLSLIKEKPKDRIKVKSYLIPESKRRDTYEFIDKLISSGQQAFVICPLISNNDIYDDKKSVQSELINLKKTILGKRKIASLHGRMRSIEKEKIISDFAKGKFDILVSTSVIEVGIDIKNATAIIIEDAHMFGLAQLHQLRGRVGRGGEQSYCFAFAKLEGSHITKDRMKAFIQNEDGFELSNFDLKLRGPGSFFNVNQSGFSGINPLWFENSKLLKDCSVAANIVLDKLGAHKALEKAVMERIIIKHLE